MKIASGEAGRGLNGENRYIYKRRLRIFLFHEILLDLGK